MVIIIAMVREEETHQIPDDGTDTNIDIVSSLDRGNNTDDDLGSGRSERHEGCACHILLQVHLHTQNLKARNEEFIANLSVRIIRR